MHIVLNKVNIFKRYKTKMIEIGKNKIYYIIKGTLQVALSLEYSRENSKRNL